MKLKDGIYLTTLLLGSGLVYKQKVENEHLRDQVQQLSDNKTDIEILMVDQVALRKTYSVLLDGHASMDDKYHAEKDFAETFQRTFTIANKYGLSKTLQDVIQKDMN